MLGPAFQGAQIDRWRLPPDTTWQATIKHYTMLLGNGWTEQPPESSGDLQLAEWRQGTLDPRRFAVALLDRVIETPEGRYKILYVAGPLH